MNPHRPWLDDPDPSRPGARAHFTRAERDDMAREEDAVDFGVYLVLALTAVVLALDHYFGWLLPA